MYWRNYHNSLYKQIWFIVLDSKGVLWGLQHPIGYWIASYMGDELGLDYMLSTSTNIQPQRPPAWRMLIVDGHSLQYALDHWIIPYALDVTLSILDMAFCHYTLFQPLGTRLFALFSPSLPLQASGNGRNQSHLSPSFLLKASALWSRRTRPASHNCPARSSGVWLSLQLRHPS